MKLNLSFLKKIPDDVLSHNEGNFNEIFGDYLKYISEKYKIDHFVFDLSESFQQVLNEIYEKHKILITILISTNYSSINDVIYTPYVPLPIDNLFGVQSDFLLVKETSLGIFSRIVSNHEYYQEEINSYIDETVRVFESTTYWKEAYDEYSLQEDSLNN
jgi:hypothetical protein